MLGAHSALTWASETRVLPQAASPRWCRSRFTATRRCPRSCSRSSLRLSLSSGGVFYESCSCSSLPPRITVAEADRARHAETVRGARVAALCSTSLLPPERCPYPVCFGFGGNRSLSSICPFSRPEFNSWSWRGRCVLQLATSARPLWPAPAEEGEGFDLATVHGSTSSSSRS